MVDFVNFQLTNEEIYGIIHTGDIVRIMRKLLTHYVGWFNRKYGRSGALIANRYKSECVEDGEYLFSIVRYIHNNPRKA